MSTEAFQREVFTLLDGEEVEIRSLSIAKMKKFMALWNGHLDELNKFIKHITKRVDHIRHHVDRLHIN